MRVVWMVRTAEGVLLAAGLAVLLACGSGPGAAGGSSAGSVPLATQEPLAPPGTPPAAPGTAPGTAASRPGGAARSAAPVPRGPQIRVTWEALAVEQERLENPRIERRPQAGLASQQKVVLVNASHVEAQTNAVGLTSGQNRGVAVGTVSDADMQLFLQGLEQRGFFRFAKPTYLVKAQLSDPNARGHVTVERDGESYTLLSMRGQGLNPATKPVVALYSDSKQAVMLLRNRTAGLSVVGLEGGVLTK